MSHERDPAAIIRQPFETHLNRLNHLKRRLATADTLTAEITASEPADKSVEPTYASPFGAVTFEELYRRTSRIAGSMLTVNLNMTNPEDVDDCLQAGYLKVWRKLQDKPDLFADKPKRYIVQAVVLNAKAQRYAHLRHYRKLAFDTKSSYRKERPIFSIRQAETWMDLAAAIHQVTLAVQDRPHLLVSLYTLITQAAVGETAPLFDYSPKTIYKYRRLMKDALAAYLPGYGPQPEGSEPESPYPAPLIMPQLFDAIAIDERIECQQQRAADREWYQMMTRRQQVRARVRPYQPSVEQFSTGWQSKASIGDLMVDPQVRRGAFAKLGQLGVRDEPDQADCFQNGVIRLWQRLQQEPELLADKGPIWVGIYIAYQGNTRKVHRHHQRVRRFSDPDFDWDAADEWLQIGRTEDGRLQHAEWAEAVDAELDFANLMQQLAREYADDLPKLLALYALTTSARLKDVAPIVGIHPKNFAAQVSNGVKAELRYRLKRDKLSTD